MRTPNRYLNKQKTKFVNFATNSDKDVMFSLLPTFLFKKNIDLGFEISVNRFVFMWGTFQFTMDIGKRKYISSVLNWKTTGLDEFIIWARKNSMTGVDKTLLDNLFKHKPELELLIKKNHCSYHYIKIILIQEIKDFRANDSIVQKVKEEREISKLAPDAQLLVSTLKNIENGNQKKKEIDPLEQLGDTLGLKK